MRKFLQLTCIVLISLLSCDQELNIISLPGLEWDDLDNPNDPENIVGNIENTELAIGDTYAGGIVFYLDGTGGGLVAAESDQSTGVEWGGHGTTIGTTSTAVGTGANNTTGIVSALGSGIYAAMICNELVLNGFDDWFLPSKDELDLMYENLHLNGIGGFDEYWLYWSSSEASFINAWAQIFGDGSQLDDNKDDGAVHVRAVRAFSITDDTTSPTPGNSGTLTFSEEDSSSITVDWTAASDETTAASDLQYQVYYSTSNNIDTVDNLEANGTAFGTITANTTSKEVTGLAADTTYYFNVLVQDEARNKSVYTSGSSVTETIASGGIPTNGLIAEYLFNGDANDSSGNDNHGILSGATLTTDRNGNAYSAYSFDGIDDNIISSSESFKTQDMTLSIWVKKIGDVGQIWGYSSPQAYYGYRLTWGRMQLTAEIGGGIAYIDALDKPNLGTDWVHFVFTKESGGNMSLYINGVVNDIVPDVDAVWTDVMSFYIGMMPHTYVNSQAYFSGLIDDIRLYNRALIEEEIISLYNDDGQTPANISTTVSYSIGDTGPAGGLIFYIDEAEEQDWTYLEAAPNTWNGESLDTTHQWGGYGISVMTSDEIGDGAANTSAIVSAYGGNEPYNNLDNYAAKVCDDLVIGNYDDWFLPSLATLYQMFLNLHDNNLGDFESGWYWTSSEATDSLARKRDFSSNGSQTYYNKSSEVYVRPVRAF